MNRLSAYLMFAVLVIPTEKIESWRIEKFSGIPRNEVSTSPKGLLIQVKQSASPLIFPLKMPEKIVGFKISGVFHGLPNFSDVSKQGEKGSDDYALRIGLIVPGEKQLTGVKRLFTTQWVKHLYAQVPSGMGLDHIHFFNITQNPSQVGKSRVHPASDLMREEFIASVEKAGPFTYEYILKQPLNTVAVWISIDGDDTKSNYDVVISKLEFKVYDQSP